MKRVRRLVAFLDRREAATSMALVRILVPTVLLVDLAYVVQYDLVEVLWLPYQEGGISIGANFTQQPEVFAWFGATPGTVRGLFATTCIAAALTAAGVFTRWSTLLLLLCHAQLAMITPEADRGIDNLFRQLYMILFFSQCGATLSVDAWIRHGRFWCPDVRVPAWPRYALMLQLVWMYFSAGIHKTQTPWTPMGDFSALYLILNDPHFVRWELGTVLHTLFPLTQLGTASTMMFEVGAPVALLAYYFRKTRDRPGRVRRLFNRLRIFWVWVFVAGSFHVALAATMRLGIFPWGVLAVYPVFLSPNEWHELGRTVARRVDRWRARPAAG